MSKDKNTKKDAVNIVDGLNNFVNAEIDIKEVVITTAKYVALIVLVMLVAAALIFSLESFIAQMAVLIIATLFIKVFLIVIWVEGSVSISREVMSYFQPAANSKDKEGQ